MQHKKGRAASAYGLAVAAVSLMAALSACGRDDGQAFYRLKADPTEKNQAKIRALLGSTDRDTRARALNALVQLKVPDARELARGALSDPDGFVRATAAKLLGDLADPDDAPALVEMLASDPDPVARRRAAEALQQVGGPVATEGLVRGLSDPMQEVRLAAVRSVRALDPAGAVPELARLLVDDPAYEVRVQAAGALGSSGSPDARPALEAALADANEFVRAAVANALEVDARTPKTLPPTPPVDETPQ